MQLLVIGPLEGIEGKSRTRYSQQITHNGLHRHKVVTDSQPTIVRVKISVLAAEWDSLWQAKQAKMSARKMAADGKYDALERTEEAAAALKEVDDLLAHAKAPDDRAIWSAMLGETKFVEAAPKDAPFPQAPGATTQPLQPRRDQAPHKFKPGVLDFLWPPRMKASREACEQRFVKAQARWEADVVTWQRFTSETLYAHGGVVDAIKAKNQSARMAWQERAARFEQAVAQKTAQVESLRSSYRLHQSAGVVAFADGALGASSLPDFVLPNWSIAYLDETKILVVEYNMPAPSDMPRLKEVRYVASRDEKTEHFITDVQADKRYDSALYQLALRAVYEVLSADSARAIEMVCLNGMVTAVNPSTGNETTSCVLSFQVKRDEFLHVNLQAVDPKECFKRFKGVAAAKLSGLAAVAPLQHIAQDDERYVDGRSVIHAVDEGVNLAAMHWEDFEHLIRELFERMFSSPGSKVNVTRGSSDGGVDVVAVDADPIRGGKIIIQAKRYTNTVGVSAVRELYGTMIAEGAQKGILVTTSSYGPDAYDWVKEKPITLLSGGNLLDLLEKHGTQARINISEAKAHFKAQSEAD